mmetsp:Transcript_30335/g.75333  ORF Transcript_30335/g.75333 Transcript_30335/m.75333 type:complete len:210 (-) Transcript_30335:172-801(-)
MCIRFAKSFEGSAAGIDAAGGGHSFTDPLLVEVCFDCIPAPLNDLNTDRLRVDVELLGDTCQVVQKHLVRQPASAPVSVVIEQPQQIALVAPSAIIQTRISHHLQQPCKMDERISLCVPVIRQTQPLVDHRFTQGGWRFSGGRLRPGRARARRGTGWGADRRGGPGSVRTSPVKVIKHRVDGVDEPFYEARIVAEVISQRVHDIIGDGD